MSSVLSTEISCSGTCSVKFALNKEHFKGSLYILIVVSLCVLYIGNTCLRCFVKNIHAGHRKRLSNTLSDCFKLYALLHIFYLSGGINISFYIGKV